MSADTWLNKINWSDDGLVPVIAQESESGKVLMFAWMNREALKLTVEKGEAGFNITKSHLDVEANVSGAVEATFNELAEKAKVNCPVSKVLKAEITMTAKLVGG